MGQACTTLWNSTAIAPVRVMDSGITPKERKESFEDSAMEIDRVSRVGAIRQEANPRERREKPRHTKSVDDVGLFDSEFGQGEPEASNEEEDEKRDGGLNLIA